ncbi:MAG: AhpC/TSA family protein [Flavisolibacter sp.]|nr:AhpC/TSA family protein [Flavisolibacter sp.]
MVYLRYAGPNSAYKNDSSVLTNNHFRFTGRTKEPAIAFLTTVKSSIPDDDDKITADGKNAVLFFLEPVSLHATLDAGNFKNGLFTGSKSQDQFAAFNSQIALSHDPAEAGNILRKSIDQHPDSYVSAYLISCHHFGLDTLSHYYGSLTPNLKKSVYGKSILENIHKRELVAPGRQAPAFTREDMNGKAISLRDFRGKYVLLEFWGSWNNACRTENQELLTEYNQYKEKDFTIIGASLDGKKTRKTLLAVIEKEHLPWVQLANAKGADNPVAIQYCVESLPANFLIDPNGKIIATDIRGESLSKKLNSMLK